MCVKDIAENGYLICVLDSNDIDSTFNSSLKVAWSLLETISRHDNMKISSV